MSEFSEQFEAYALALRSPDEEIQLLTEKNKRDHFIGVRAVEARKMELQLVDANTMREDAKSIVGLIPDDILPTTLIITESHFEIIEDDGETSQRQLYNKGGMKVDTTQRGKKKAWIVSTRYQRTVEDDTQTMIFAPILLVEDGELWIAPKHELRSYEDFTNMSVQEEIGRKQALYRKAMRGQDLEGRPKRYRSRVDSNSPRPATDEDLVPVEKLSILQLEADQTTGQSPELVVDWRNDLLAMVKV